jgi:hypothetical protein
MTKVTKIEQQETVAPAHKNIFSALIAAQSEMGPLLKGEDNPHFRSKYADLDALMKAAKPALNRNGIAPWHQIVTIEGVEYMRTIFTHAETEATMHCDVRLIVGKNDMQGYKSATTYAKRIGMESLTGLAPEDDDGNAAANSMKGQRSEPKPPAQVDDPEGAVKKLKSANTVDDLNAAFRGLTEGERKNKAVIDAGAARKAELEAPIDDEIPY